jgi:hypothetical protein
VDILRWPVLVVEVDGSARGTLAQLTVSVRIGCAVDRLEDQAHVLPVREGTSKCRDNRVRVLAREVTVDVEHERKHERAVVHVQPSAAA